MSDIGATTSRKVIGSVGWEHDVEDATLPKTEGSLLSAGVLVIVCHQYVQSIVKVLHSERL